MKTVYISTPLSKEKFEIDLIQKKILGNPGYFFYIPSTSESINRKRGLETHIHHLNLCDELWAFGRIGLDCSWEIGYATGLGKKVKLFIAEDNEYIIDDSWMPAYNAEIIRL